MLISDSQRGDVTVGPMRISMILVMHCAFLRGRHSPDLYTSILARHFLMNLDSCSLVWDGSVPLDEEGPSPCSVMGFLK